jgi:mono/diheme cytochrome c family protein
MKRAAVLVLALLGGCDEMANQPKDAPYRASTLFPDGKAMQAPPEGTVARGDLANEAMLVTRPAMTQALLERGRERFEIFCTPCHGRLGNGEGPIVQRGFPPPPSYHQPRLREAPDAHFIDVISNGYGAMYGYGDRVRPADRWAIVAYIRALQLSQNAKVADLPVPARGAIDGAPP